MDQNESMISFFEMNSEMFVAVNLPASVFSILLNIFFIYCVVFQQSEQEQLKQPLNVLQGIHIGCNIMISVYTLLKAYFDVFYPSWYLMPFMFSQSEVYVMMASVTTSFWQNVFYYFQITPAKSYFIWLKKNICAFIYCALLINGTFYLLELSLVTAIYLIFQFDYYDSLPDINSLFEINDIWYVLFGVTLALMILNLCGLSASSCAIVIFLWKHLKNMVESKTLSSPRFQRQMRMTIRSIAIHAVLHFICSMVVILDLSIYMYSNLYFDLDYYILCTTVSFYALGTTINLGISQSLFRKQVVYAWKKMFPMFYQSGTISTTFTILSD